MSLQDHPIAAIFPLLPEAELKELAADIEERGLLQPILLLDGKILDGRNRYRACQMCGVTPETATYTGTDPVKDTLSLNLHRRHLSMDQRAIIAAKLSNLSPGRPSETASGEAVSQTQAAEALSVSRSSVQRAKQVIEKAPDLAEQVAAGTITVHAAQKAIAAAADPKKIPRGITKSPSRCSTSRWQFLSSRKFLVTTSIAKRRSTKWPRGSPQTVSHPIL